MSRLKPLEQDTIIEIEFLCYLLFGNSRLSGQLEI